MTWPGCRRRSRIRRTRRRSRTDRLGPQPQRRRGRSYSQGMAWFRRRRTERFVLQDAGPPSAAEVAAADAARRAEQHRSLRRIAAEAVILQDEAEAVIQGIRARESLGYLAPRGGPLVRRFFALRDALPRR